MQGLPVPAPVAAQYRRGGLTYRGDLITERIADAQPRLVSACSERAVTEATWRAIGSCIRRFHDAGVCHADLNAHNILLDRSWHAYSWSISIAAHAAHRDRWRVANLARLKRSLLKICRELPADRLDSRAWSALRAGYDDAEVTSRAELR